MISATTLDSRGVTIHYDITNAPIGQPISFAIERSAAPMAEAGDVSVGTVTVNPPSRGRPAHSTPRGSRPRRSGITR